MAVKIEGGILIHYTSFTEIIGVLGRTEENTFAKDPLLELLESGQKIVPELL